MTIRVMDGDRAALLRVQREMAEKNDGIEPSQSDVALYLLRRGIRDYCRETA